MQAKDRKYSPEETLARICAWCDRQERSTLEVKKKLAQWGVPGSETEKTIRFLKEKRFLDDLRFAAAFANDRMQFRNWGELKVRNALRMKGVEGRLIDEAIASLEHGIASDTIERAFQSALKKGHKLDDYKSRMKLARHLAAKGFQPDAIWKILDQQERF